MQPAYFGEVMEWTQNAIRKQKQLKGNKNATIHERIIKPEFKWCMVDAFIFSWY